MRGLLCLYSELYYSFLTYIVNVKYVLIHYLCYEMVINVFVLPDIL